MASVVVQQGVLSPAASANSPAPSAHGGYSHELPASRTHPLKPGGKKEIALINYVDERILRMTRRYGKKYVQSAANDDAPGYTSFEQVLEDLEAVFEVVWVSGTPALQTPYLLSLAGMFCSYMPAFPFSAATFHAASRFDLAFVTLLAGHSDPHAPDRPANSSQVSKTERVRIKSLVEATRVVVVQTAMDSGHSAQIQEVSSSEETDSDEGTNGHIGDKPHDNEISIGISKIYKRTLEILGDSLT